MKSRMRDQLESDEIEEKPQDYMGVENVLSQTRCNMYLHQWSKEGTETKHSY